MNSEIVEELKKVKAGLKPPGIAVIGKTGTGKSSLIKAIFKLDDSQIKTGAGLPQTQFYERYPSVYDESVPIFLYDSPGYEADKTKEFMEDTISFLKEKALVDNTSKSKEEKERVHLVWYVMSAVARIEYFDRKVIEEIASLKVPSIIVLNQCDIAKPKQISEIKKTIDELALPEAFVHQVIEVSADPKDGESFGLDDLVKFSIEMIPETYSNAFILAQQINVKAKKKVAWAYVAAAATACFASAYIPIPGSTPAAVLTVQTGLLTKISEVYNVRKYLDPKIALATFTLSTALTVAATTVLDIASTAVFLATPLWVTGETASGATAATYTVVSGLAMISTLEALSVQFLSSDMNKEEINKFFKAKFKEDLARYSEISISNPSDLTSIKKRYVDV